MSEQAKRVLRWWPIILALLTGAFFVGGAFATFVTKTELKETTRDLDAKIEKAVDTHERWEREKLTPMANDIEEIKRDLKEALKKGR
jgi:hypothetical protein